MSELRNVYLQNACPSYGLIHSNGWIKNCLSINASPSYRLCWWFYFFQRLKWYQSLCSNLHVNWNYTFFWCAESGEKMSRQSSLWWNSKDVWWWCTWTCHVILQTIAFSSLSYNTDTYADTQNVKCISKEAQMV